jgi:acid-sensing ion channel, other
MSGLNCFSEYSENSSIHGIKYIGERNRSACERSYWICSVVMAFLGCSFMIYEIYDKWENSPVIITFSENLRIISDVPFPAVTICPMSKFKNDEFDFKEAFKILRRADSQQDRRKMAESIEDSKNFEAGLFACDKDPALKDGLEAAKLKGNDVIRRIKNISYSIPKTKQSYFYSYVTYQGKSESFRDYFTEIITEEGVCYSSNMLDMFEIFENENMLVL